MTCCMQNGVMATLKGTKAWEAFYITIGSQFITQNNIHQGKPVVLVGIALVKPAEFEALRFEKKALKDFA